MEDASKTRREEASHEKEREEGRGEGNNNDGVILGVRVEKKEEGTEGGQQRRSGGRE